MKLPLTLLLITLPPAQPGPRIFVRLISSPSIGKLEEALRVLEQDEAFRNVARRYSEHPSVQMGGFIGEVRLAEFEGSDLQTVLTALEPGAYTEIVEFQKQPAILFRLPAGFRQEANRLLKDADRLAERGDLQEAVDRYKASLDVYPHFIHAHLALGLAYSQLGETEKAESAYRRAIAIAPDFHQAYHNLGALLWVQGRAAEAIAAFEKALAIKPDLFRSQVNLVGIYNAVGRNQEAIEMARRALLTDPLLPSAYYALGTVYLANDLEKAHENFSMAAFLNRANPDFGLAVVTTLVRLGRLEEAREKVQQLMKQHKGYGPAVQLATEIEQLKQRRPQKERR